MDYSGKKQTRDCGGGGGSFFSILETLQNFVIKALGDFKA